MSESYVINDDTVVVMAVNDSCCKIYEIENDFIVNKSLQEVLEESCKYYGSSLKGRLEGSKYVFNCSYKLPIVINQYSNSIFFTTRSYKSLDTYIVCYNNIKFYEKNRRYTNIYVENGKKIVIEEGYRLFENQYSRANLLYMKLQMIKNTPIC